MTARDGWTSPNTISCRGGGHPHMKRRVLLLGIALLSVARPTLGAEQRRITILHSGYPNRTPVDRLYGALRSLGHDDRTSIMLLLGGEGDTDRLKQLVQQVAEQRPDVTIALTSPAARALKEAGIKSPVVFAFVPDPVEQGIVNSLARPGGNFTGISYSGLALGGKRLDLLIEAVPGIRQIAVLWSRNFFESAGLVDEIHTAARSRGVSIFSRELNGVADLAPAFAEAEGSGATGLIFITDNVMFGRRKEIADLAIAHHLPSMHSFGPEVADGG
jgi:putative ABC transport system substrate-binding protein